MQGQHTPLHGAAYHGHVRVVSMLLAAGADIQSRNVSRGGGGGGETRAEREWRSERLAGNELPKHHNIII